MSSLPLVMRIEPQPSSLPGAWRYTGKKNEEMVDKFAHTGIISTKDVEDAFRAVPRGAFVPPDLQDEAYVDAPIRGDPHVHLSAPHMYATVLEALQLTPGKCNQLSKLCLTNVIYDLDNSPHAKIRK